VSRGLIKPRDFEVLMIYSSSFFLCVFNCSLALGNREKEAWTLVSFFFFFLLSNRSGRGKVLAHTVLQRKKINI
jgi:hypothetical protein